MDVFVGIDQSLQEPGVVVLAGDGSFYKGASLPTKKERGATRLGSIARFVRDMVGANNVVLASAIEGPSLGSTHREFDLGTAFGAVQTALALFWGSEPYVVEPVRLKYFATGHWQAEKEDVIHAVKSNWGLTTDNDNVADAYVLARIAYGMLNGPGKRRVEAEILRDLAGVKKAPRRAMKRDKDNV